MLGLVLAASAFSPLLGAELILQGRLDLPETGDWWEPLVVRSGDLLVTAAADPGAVAIYHRAPHAPLGWELDGLVDSDDTPGAAYRSAAISGSNVVAARSGYLEVLERGTDGWTVQQTLVVAAAGSGFGWLLAADDDRLVVLARRGGTSGQTLLVVYRRVGPSFELEATLEPDLRGCDGLILSGHDLIVAGRRSHPALPQVLSYRFNETTWDLVDSLEVLGLSNFPVPVALAGDLLAVGRSEVQVAPPLSGAVDLYERSEGGAWGLAATLTTTAEGMVPEFARFGASVAVSPEGVVMVAARAMQSGCPADPTCVFVRRDARLYAFRFEHGEWTEIARWIGPGDGIGIGLPAGVLAYSIALDGDRVIATAPFAPEPGLRVFALLPETLEVPALSPTAAVSLALLLGCCATALIARRR